MFFPWTAAAVSGRSYPGRAPVLLRPKPRAAGGRRDGPIRGSCPTWPPRNADGDGCTRGASLVFDAAALLFSPSGVGALGRSRVRAGELGASVDKPAATPAGPCWTRSNRYVYYEVQTVLGTLCCIGCLVGPGFARTSPGRRPTEHRSASGLAPDQCMPLSPYLAKTGEG